MSHILGIDIGTTATKGTLLSADGVVRAETSVPSDLISPRPGHAEADPEQWWRNACEVSRRVLDAAGVPGGEVAAVGVSGMTPTLVALDSDDRPLRPSIQQNDSRAGEEIKALAEAVPSALERTGSAVTAQSIGPKWTWLRRHEPEIVAATERITGSYGYVTGRLTGRWVAEANWALESGLSTLDGDWDDEIMAVVHLEPDLLGDIVPSTEVVGTVLPEAAVLTGLESGTPVVAGCADHVASACAAGLVETGDVLLKLGGAADVLAVSDHAVVDARIYLDCHPLAARWLPNGCMATAGSLLRWFQRELAAGEHLATLDEQAAAVEPGSNGLVVLPFFLGEKSPLNDPDLRGAFAGLHLGHTRAHLYRAMLEGIAYGFAHHMQVLGEVGVPVRNVRITNGGSRSPLWCQIVADVCGVVLESLAYAGGSSLGVALVAAEGAGPVPAQLLLNSTLQVAELTEPNQRAQERYESHLATYYELIDSTRPALHTLARESRR